MRRIPSVTVENRFRSFHFYEGTLEKPIPLAYGTLSYGNNPEWRYTLVCKNPLINAEEANASREEKGN